MRHKHKHSVSIIYLTVYFGYSFWLFFRKKNCLKAAQVSYILTNKCLGIIDLSTFICFYFFYHLWSKRNKNWILVYHVFYLFCCKRWEVIKYFVRNYRLSSAKLSVKVEGRCALAKNKSIQIRGLWKNKLANSITTFNVSKERSRHFMFIFSSFGIWFAEKSLNIKHKFFSCFYTCCYNLRLFELNLVKLRNYIFFVKYPAHHKQILYLSTSSVVITENKVLAITDKFYYPNEQKIQFLF